jgi:hypothetical protein
MSFASKPPELRPMGGVPAGCVIWHVDGLVPVQPLG